VTFIVLTEQLPSGSSLARDFPYFIRGDDEGDALAPVRQLELRVPQLQAGRFAYSLQLLLQR
jgi:hypothetical protein